MVLLTDWTEGVNWTHLNISGEKCSASKNEVHLKKAAQEWGQKSNFPIIKRRLI